MSESLTPALLDDLHERVVMSDEAGNQLAAPLTHDEALALIAAARESTPAPTEARFKWEPGQDHQFVEVKDSNECGHPVDDPDVPYCGLPWGEHGPVAARTAPASEVATSNAEARLAAISELVETGQQFMTRNRFTDALRAILRDEAAATNAQSVINAAHVAQGVLRQNDRHFAELLAEADRIDGVMVNGTNVAAVLRNMVDEHEAHA